jgi:hypothetical protein
MAFGGLQNRVCLAEAQLQLTFIKVHSPSYRDAKCLEHFGLDKSGPSIFPISTTETSEEVPCSARWMFFATSVLPLSLSGQSLDATNLSVPI